ncbi:T9SS type A sorting domain-containing protein [Hymenobacter sp. J193]|uniref:T9SS type A sorting domain-containing protein n=1 Tax=Hymenobacter sp. J193 TaxID=2898429 RepID=UPI002151D8E9|nr:T9SS type A sorting domain-containing protein [Hymenobacter sp. J193]MCR5888488.1 T9SS type A sorting domain-containing protein [Hymenobacter sp. J193]
MKKFVLPAFLLAALLSSSAQRAQAQAPVVTVKDKITANTTWSNKNVYLLDGFVRVADGATLTIEPGTVIKGKKDTQGTLIVEQGGKLMADGTASQPIVFTSNSDKGKRARGDWGGVILLGRAPQNISGTTAVIEGGVNGVFGGTVANDNSGILRYVRIEFPGVAFQPDNEINGLTLGGVGSGTIIDHVQISYSGDDSFEWFGGSVNAKHLVAFRGLDDDFDSDNGFSGKVQYAVALRDPEVADISGSNSFESDNDKNGSANSPKTSAVFSNVSSFLPASTNLNSDYKRAMHIRRNSALSVFNSVFTGWPTGLLLDGTPSEANATSGELQIKNTVLASAKTNFAAASGSSYDVAGFFNAATRNNQLTTTDALSLNADNFSLTAPKFMPLAASSLQAGADFTDAKISGEFFDKVAFRGAFGAEDWTAGWTNFDPQNTDYASGITTASRKKSDQLAGLSVYPNPAAGQASVAFVLRRGATAAVRVLDVTGREVAQLSQPTKLAAGAHELRLPSLKAGVYVATVVTEETTQAVRFVVTQ